MSPTSEARQGSSRPFSGGPFGRLAGETGTAVVEFALIAPVLFLLVIGILDFGRALNYYNDLTQLAGQGARAAAVDRNPDGTTVGTADANCAASPQTVQCQLAKTYPTTGELKSGIAVCLGTLNTSTNQIDGSMLPPIGSAVTVRTKYRFHFLPIVNLGTLTLSATQSEILEQTPTPNMGGNVTASGGPDACAP
jgi:Flp pilus assembly protein TadG